MIGKIIFKTANTRSKSEGVYPYLQIEEDKFIKIRRANENPFENTTLKGFEGKTVSVEGELNENNTLIVTQIAEVVDETEQTEEDND